MRKSTNKLHNKVVFKDYNPNQLQLLPPSLDSLIAKHHPVRVVSRIIEGIDLSNLLKTYKGGGRSSYHPKMLLKVWIYGYLRNIYSSRKLEQALQEHVHFMWLSGMQTPDHNTLNNFRSGRLNQAEVKSIFKQVVLLLVEEGLLDIRQTYTDGTKLEANANRYSFVWAKAIKYHKDRMHNQLEEWWKEVERVYKKEAEEAPEKPVFKEMRSEQVEAAIQAINDALSNKELSSKKKAKLRYINKNYGVKIKEYEKKEAILAGRNSYSKTDESATFMRTKEDHMKNGQLKPCYNVQFSTSDKFVVNYSLGQTTADTTLYSQHIENYQSLYGFYPNNDTADAGYGSEENYEFLEERGVEAFVKYSRFHWEQKPKNKKDPSKVENLHYNEQEDCYYCPMGQKMACVGQQKRKTRTGFEQEIFVYQAQNCKGCPMRKVCHKAKGNRKVYRNKRLERYKAIARQKLTSEEGVQKRGQRCVDVEGTFGQLKHNKNFRRFSLRGLEKVNLETGILAISMNLDRAAKKLKRAAMGEVCPLGSVLEKSSQNKAKLAPKTA